MEGLKANRSLKDVSFVLTISLILLSSTPPCVLSANMTSEYRDVSATIKQVLQGYDKNNGPSIGGPSVTVQVTMFVGAFGEFNSRESIFDINFYLRQTWKDSRLSFQSNSTKKISLTPSFLDDIWFPDTTFVNVKDAKLHYVTSRNQLVHLWPDGTILTSTRVSATVYCHMELHDYPFDVQMCNLIFGSYGYDKSEIDYTWKYKEKAENLKYGEHVEIKQFSLVDFRTLRLEKDFGETGIFTKLSFEFTLKRDIGFFIINLYFPATLLVILSWVSFWLRQDQTPARVALGITTALTLMTLISGAQTYMPHVPYIRAIDWFLIICFICVIGALLEYAAVHHFGEQLPVTKDMNSHIEDEMDMNHNHETTGSDATLNQVTINNNMQHRRPLKTAKTVKMARNVSTIDRISRSAFPVVFISLNCVYWSIYLS